ncbi:hypothetical protein HN51_018749 [Arachis hypogaea]|uniref:Protein PHLOEM PROTEIN 2-LIKE A10 n=2 Tax=Arachis TaxID=3817 RepID=A0A445BUG8_ARAHY|nr:protein PHLOEM PROTEIN 2-LIKE A10 [Arachis duranensis]XP_025613492.1 protein PHLOEM PROTEIN 2-LIKE A10 [Arachis hypogaea]QHO30391.1 Protein PHLOEM PROTEIN 2-LIKE [Arachis hypogaea]RYR42365.1 hypothetical protein Ahy_A08g038834 [Arachis hypogaea]
MEGQLIKKGFDFSRRNKKWLLLVALFGASGYGAYKAYHSPSVARKRERLMKLVKAFVSLSELVAESSETIATVSKDLNRFLNSDSDEIPNSLKQLSKIATSKECSASVNKVSEAVTIGLLLGLKTQQSNGKSPEFITNPNCATDRVLEKLFSKAGTGFASVVVGSFARNLVLGLQSAESGVASSDSPAWLNVISDERCGKVIGDVVQVFVSTAVAVFLDKTMDVNNFDEMFAGMTNPKHQEQVKGILVSVCNGAVETLVRTSHQVLTNSRTQKSNLSASSSSGSNVNSLVLSGSIVTGNGCVEPIGEVVQHFKVGGLVGGGVQDAGLLGQIKSTMAVPANRRFVLDVTGRVTMEALRSFVALFLWRISDALNRSLKNVHDEAVHKGSEVVRYVGAKSSVMFTLFLAFYLHILGGSTLVLPA